MTDSWRRRFPMPDTERTIGRRRVRRTPAALRTGEPDRSTSPSACEAPGDTDRRPVTRQSDRAAEATRHDRRQDDADSDSDKRHSDRR